MGAIITILSVFAVIGFVALCYFIGNFLLGTFDEGLREQVISTGTGFLILVLLVIVGLFLMFLYAIAYGVFTNLLT